MVGTGLGAESGILIKGGESLENAYRLTTVVFDKTGTLTRGEPEVTDIVPAAGRSPEEVLRIALALEAVSEHPLARAVLAKGEKEGLAAEPVEGFGAVSGLGAKAYPEREILSPRQPALHGRGGCSRSTVWKGRPSDWPARGRRSFSWRRRGRSIGLMGFSDLPKPSAREAVAALKGMGLRVAMITGDNAATAKAMGEALGIDRVLAEVLPGDKAEEIRRLRAGGEVVAMVGDGINDAPALAAADIGIAIGAGTDVAIEASDITLMKEDLLGVPQAIRLSFATMRTIRQNLFWAFIYNIIGIPIAAGVLYPFWGILLNPEFAAAAMAMSSVSVVSNSLRLRRTWRRVRKG